MVVVLMATVVAVGVMGVYRAFVCIRFGVECFM